jgi:hypothetical protein
VGALGGVVSTLGQVWALALLLVDLLIPVKSMAVTVNVLLVLGVRWRMITDMDPAGAAAALMFCVSGLPFKFKL